MADSDYELLADLLAHPTEGYLDRVRALRDALAASYPVAAPLVESFHELLPKGSLRELQELHTRSFDVQAITTLDVGYVLFGEDYKRGELLSNLMREHREAGNELRDELADFFPNLLRLLPKMQDRQLATELVQEIIGPALRQMIAEFDPARIEKKDELYHKHHKTLIDSSTLARTAYRLALQAVREVLDADYHLIDKPLIEKTSDFLASIRTELNVEDDVKSKAKRRTGAVPQAGL